MHLNFWVSLRALMLLFFFWSQKSSSVHIHLTQLGKLHRIDFISNDYFTTAQQHVIDIMFPWFDRFFVQGRRYDKRRHQKPATPLEHEKEWSCCSLPIFSASRALQHPYPRALCTLPSFARIERPRVNNQHLQSHGKIGDCEQSRWPMKLLFMAGFSVVCDQEYSISTPL